MFGIFKKKKAASSIPNLAHTKAPLLSRLMKKKVYRAVITIEYDGIALRKFETEVKAKSKMDAYKLFDEKLKLKIINIYQDKNKRNVV